MQDWSNMCAGPELLTFDEKTHIYRLDGSVIPSVTTVMKLLSLSEYGGVREDVLANAATRGSAVHHAIENYINFGIEDISEEYKPYFLAFLKFLSDKQPNILSSEGKVYHRFLRYAGTVDLICEINGEIFLIDFKTTAVMMRMLTEVQLEAYKQAIESHGFKIDKKAIVHLKNDGTYRFEPQGNDSECWNVFGSLLTVNSYMKKHKK